MLPALFGQGLVFVNTPATASDLLDKRAARTSRNLQSVSWRPFDITRRGPSLQMQLQQHGVLPLERRDWYLS